MTVLFYSLWIFFLQLRMEICRIFEDMGFCKNFKVAISGTWLPRIMAYVKGNNKPLFTKLYNEMEQAVGEGLSQTGQGLDPESNI